MAVAVAVALNVAWSPAASIPIDERNAKARLLRTAAKIDKAWKIETDACKRAQPCENAAYFKHQDALRKAQARYEVESGATARGW